MKNDQKKIVACHHENGTIQEVKLDDGTVVKMAEVVNMAKDNVIKNFTVSTTKNGKEVLRGKRESLPDTRLYDLPRF